MHIGLLAETGIEQIDSILRGLVGLFEVSFPGRIRGCYLTGSYSDGTAVDLGRTLHSSDIDTVIASCRSRVRHRTLLLLEDNGAQRRTHERRLDCTDLRGH